MTMKSCRARKGLRESKLYFSLKYLVNSLDVCFDRLKTLMVTDENIQIYGTELS